MRLDGDKRCFASKNRAFVTHDAGFVPLSRVGNEA